MKLRGPIVPGLFVILLLSTTLRPQTGYAQTGEFTVGITYPQNGNEVAKEINVQGTASIPSGNYLWLLARRIDFEPLWWPQREARIDLKSRRWQAVANLGEPRDIGSEFDIGIITVDAAGHAQLRDYWIKAMKTGDWRPIEIPPTTSPPRIVRVRKVRH